MMLNWQVEMNVKIHRRFKYRSIKTRRKLHEVNVKGENARALQ